MLKVDQTMADAMFRRAQILLMQDPSSLTLEGRTCQLMAYLLATLPEVLRPIDMVGDVDAFHLRFGIGYRGPVREIPQEMLEFRHQRLQAELDEYMSAKKLKDRADALIDLIYIALGNLHLMGFPTREGWRRVHEKNMAKVRAKSPADSEFRSIFDIIKPPGWTPADLSDLTGELGQPVK